MSENQRQELCDRLQKLGRVNDPFLGNCDAKQFAAGSPLWPGAQWADVRHFKTCSAMGREVVEYRYFKSATNSSYLPVAFVFDADAGNGAGTADIYSDHHLVADRGPMRELQTDLVPWQNENDVLFAYFKALKANRIDEIMGFFEPSSYFQHSDGTRHTGLDEIRADFAKMLGDDGIQIEYCRVTDDLTTCIIECYMPTGRPAIAIYERASTKLHAVRIYL